jgi:hypothetical protein
MYKPPYALIFVLLIFLTACTLPEPVERATPSSPVIVTEVGPSATATEGIALQPVETQVALDTATSSPTAVEETQASAQVIVETAQPENLYRYSLQMGTPAATANFLQPEAGCSWMGIGGQVFNRNDRPVAGLIVEVGGILDGSPILLLSITGDSTALGPGGYEVKLADGPVASQGTLWLQLHDLMGIPQSEKIYFDTYSGEGECDRNLVIINFRELSNEQVEQYLPSIFKAP